MKFVKPELEVLEVELETEIVTASLEEGNPDEFPTIKPGGDF